MPRDAATGDDASDAAVAHGPTMPDGSVSGGACAGRVLQLEYAPAARVQYALWIETMNLGVFRTLRLTDATARRGLGNRPGAMQMNSGYHWPYGRRESVLPYWALRRLAAGQPVFPRVVSQSGLEGYATRSTDVDSPDAAGCFSYDPEVSSREGLDAVSCATMTTFRGDKGRYLTAEEVGSYAEPFEDGDGTGTLRLLGLTSAYPPRRDLTRCTADDCFDHPDVDRFATDALSAMPELDAVTTATVPDGEHVSLSFVLPDELPERVYRLVLEVHSEGDYNAFYNDETFPTPTEPPDQWDAWAINYGYPYRGQPSLVFEANLDFTTDSEQLVTLPSGYTDHTGQQAVRTPLDDTITNNPLDVPGSGVDRLRQLGDDGERIRVRTFASGARDTTFVCEPLP